MFLTGCGSSQQNCTTPRQLVFCLVASLADRVRRVSFALGLRGCCLRGCFVRHALLIGCLGVAECPQYLGLLFNRWFCRTWAFDCWLCGVQSQQARWCGCAAAQPQAVLSCGKGVAARCAPVTSAVGLQQQQDPLPSVQHGEGVRSGPAAAG